MLLEFFVVHRFILLFVVERKHGHLFFSLLFLLVSLSTLCLISLSRLCAYFSRLFSGRRISSTGRRDLDRIASQLVGAMSHTLTVPAPVSAPAPAPAVTAQ